MDEVHGILTAGVPEPESVVVDPIQVDTVPVITGDVVIVIDGVAKTTFPGPTLPELSPNQEIPSYTISKVSALVPAASGVVAPLPKSLEAGMVKVYVPVAPGAKFPAV